MMYKICAITDIGCLRKNNEDGFFALNSYAYNKDYMLSYEILSEPICVFVADGVGGSDRGEVAVKICIDYIKDNQVPSTYEQLDSALKNMNMLVCNKRKTTDTASTISGILIGSKEKIAFNVGDSKIFVINNGYLEQISIDDTLSGLTGTEPQTENEPLIQYIGKKDITPHYIKDLKGSKWLICSDGLTNMVSIDRIEEILATSEISSDVCNMLINEAKLNGGCDNITIIFIEECEEDE